MKLFRTSFAAAIISSALLMPCASALEPVDYVNPFIGTSGHGHTFPGATLPFGMVQLSPDTGTSEWDWCSGYHWSDRSLLGFSHTHLSGTGCPDLGDILFAPLSGSLKLSPGTKDHPETGYRSTFSHTNEQASPGYYKVKLDSGVQAELTATEHVGMHRYTFPAGAEQNLVVDLTSGIGNKPLDLQLNVVADRELTGYRRSRGWAKNKTIYFVADFSQPFSAFGTATANNKPQVSSRQARGKNVKGWVTFTSAEPVVARVGISTTSIEAARKNMQAEAPDFDFDKKRTEARAAWNHELSKIKVDDGEKKDMDVFYSSLYHCFVAPNVISDSDGQYRGADHKVHKTDGFRNYSTFSLWDTFRAAHPLYTLVQPERVAEMVRAFEEQARYDKHKVLPIWPLYANETYCMIGYHSFPVIAEAYLKGLISKEQAKKLFDLMLANSKRNDKWAGRGYIASNQETQSVSKTLEFAYDDYALAKLADALGDTADRDKFMHRAENYKNLFDKETGFMRGRLANGSWHSPFDPGDVGNKSRDFTEGDAWQYSFFAPQDVQGLIALFGGNEKFVKKLDELFVAPADMSARKDLDIDGLIGQYAHGNEPSHHIAYLYSYAGQPWRTADRVSQVRQTMYKDSEDGVCGNEDCGQMSAWYVFSALGFYPVNPVQGAYVFGQPLFKHLTLTIPGGKTLVVQAPNLSSENKYIAKVLLNGTEIPRAYITHGQLTSGGTLEFVMGPTPNSSWATTADAAPPAMSQPITTATK